MSILGWDAYLGWAITSDDIILIIFSLGQISLKTPLDYEKQKQHVFPVTAAVSSPVTQVRVASVVVNVLNINDVAPIFIGQPFMANITEAHLIQTEVLKIQAYDEDGDSLTYTIVGGGDNKFMINQDGTIKLIGSLDYDVKNTYKLNISVSDNKTTKYTMAAIYITPVTKLPPRFTQSLYVISIPETTPAGSSILNVTAVNIIQSGNFSINEQEGRVYFHIDGSGVIRTNLAVDHEIKKQHIFTIKVQDIRNSGHATVVVNIVNDDDTCPVLTPAFQTVQITEPVAANTIVAAVQARDVDSPSLNFSLIGGNGMFKVDSYGGIKTVGEIDITQSTEYVLNITVEDEKCSKSVQVNVNINPLAPCPDCNTYPFTQTMYEYSIFENVIPSTPIITVATGQAQFRNFSIEEPMALDHVTIDRGTGNTFMTCSLCKRILIIRKWLY